MIGGGGSITKIELSAKVGVPTDIIVTLEKDGFWLSTSKGYIQQYKKGEAEKFSCNLERRLFKNAIRKLAILKDQQLLAASSDGRLLLVNPFKEDQKVVTLGGEEQLGIISALTCSLDGCQIYIGNDNGDIHLCSLSKDGFNIDKSFEHHDDYISDITLVSMKKTLLVSSGDGTLSVIDLKKGRLLASSKNLKTDLMTIKVIPKINKILLGTARGSLEIFKWSFWGAPHDSLKAQKHKNESINDILLVEEELSIIVTASNEGVLRLLPTAQLNDGAEILKVEDSFEKLAWLQGECSGKGMILALTSNEPTVYVVSLTPEYIEDILLSVAKSNSKCKAEDSEEEESSSECEDSYGIKDIVKESSEPPIKRAKVMKRDRLESSTKDFFQDLD